MTKVLNTRSTKLFILPTLVAALFLGACGDKKAATPEADANAQPDAQTQVEQNATAVATDDTAHAGMDHDTAVAGDDVAVAEAADTGDVAVASGDDMLDGTETEEHISTN
jgi:predicted small lipoprotein YifL